MPTVPSKAFERNTMYKLIVSDLGTEDLDKIISYIINDLHNPGAATSLLNEIEKSYGFLKSNPEMHSTCYDLRLARDGYHRVVIKNFVAVYRIHKESKTVFIVRFFYGSQDYTNLI